MINLITSALKAAIDAFVTAKYSAVADVTGAPVYILPDFDPTDKDGYKKLNKVTNYGFVIHAISGKPDETSPATFVKIRYACSLTVLRKGTQLYDLTNRKDSVAQGYADPLVTSIFALATNLTKYIRTYPNGLLSESGSYQAFLTDIKNVGELKRTGDYSYVTLDVESLRMETETIS